MNKSRGRTALRVRPFLCNFNHNLEIGAPWALSTTQAPASPRASHAAACPRAAHPTHAHARVRALEAPTSQSWDSKRTIVGPSGVAKPLLLRSGKGCAQTHRPPSFAPRRNALPPAASARRRHGAALVPNWCTMAVPYRLCGGLASSSLAADTGPRNRHLVRRLR